MILPWYTSPLHIFRCLIVFDGTLMVVSCKYMQILFTSHHTKEAKASQNRKSSHCLILLVIFDPRAQVAPEHCGFLGWCREACYCFEGRGNVFWYTNPSHVITSNHLKYVWIIVNQLEWENGYLASKPPIQYDPIQFLYCCLSGLPNRAGSWSNSLVQLTPRASKLSRL